MKTSQRGLAEIAGHEAIVTTRYKDSVGVWTIGIGHTSGAGAPNPAQITRELSVSDVMEIFARDIKKFEARVNRAFTKALTQSQFDAAVSFDFNTGGIHRASWVKAFNRGDTRAARKAFMKWKKPPEIIPRRQAECNLFFDGKYKGDGKVSVYTASSSGKVQWSSGRRVKLPNVRKPIAPVEPINVDAPKVPQMPTGIDKPMVQSKTNWITTLLGAVGSVGSFFVGLDPWIQGMIIGGILFGVAYVIYERKRYRDEARAIKAAL